MTVIKLDKNTYEATIAGERIIIKTTSAGYIYYISETKDEELITPYHMVKLQNTIDMLHY